MHDYHIGLAQIRQANEAMRRKAEEHQMHEAWFRACREIIDRCVAPDMYPQARVLLDKAMAAAISESPDNWQAQRGYRGQRE